MRELEGLRGKRLRTQLRGFGVLGMLANGVLARPVRAVGWREGGMSAEGGSKRDRLKVRAKGGGKGTG